MNAGYDKIEPFCLEAVYEYSRISQQLCLIRESRRDI